MRCGHTIHRTCYDEHMQSSYKCPTCSKSTVNMETQFHRLQRAIDSQPMPPQFQDTKAIVSCNDCSAKSAVTYHWLGLKCAVCHSYNTVQLSIISDPPPGPVVSDTEDTDPENSVPSNLDPNQAGIDTSNTYLGVDSIPQRRYSSHVRPTLLTLGSQRPRIARSVSPARRGYFDSSLNMGSGDTNDGENGSRGVDTQDPPNDKMDSEDDDDSSSNDYEEDDDDEEDDFELRGHR